MGLEPRNLSPYYRKMTAEKAATLKLLREGTGIPVEVLETREDADCYELRAYLPDCSDDRKIPVLFMLTTIAFLEASPVRSKSESEYSKVDGWMPADFLSLLKFDGSRLEVSMSVVRGRGVWTQVALTPLGELMVRTQGRKDAAMKWLSYVRGAAEPAARPAVPSA